MADEKKIRISVDDSKLHDLKRTTQELANDMIRSSRSYTTSSKEVLRDLEDQIKLIEKRIRLEKESQISNLRTQFQEGKISQQAMRSGITNVNTSSQQDKLQTALLREIIDAIKSSAKEEIKENRAGVEKSIRRDKSVNRLGVTGSPEEALKRSIQQDMLGTLGEEESIQKSKFRQYGRFTERTSNVSAGYMTAKNDMFAVAGLLSLIPLVGAGLGSIVNRGLTAGENAGKSATSYGVSRMARGSYEMENGKYKLDEKGNKIYINPYDTNYNKFKDINTGEWSQKMGLSTSQALNRQSSLQTSLGSEIGEKTLRQMLGAEKFIGAGSMSQLTGISRYGQNDTMSVMRILEGNQRNVTRLTENISAYVQASNTSLNISSTVDEAKIAKTVMGISKATGQQGIGLNQTVGAIQGLGQNQNPVVKSLMMQAFRKTNPKASLFDIQAMMEDPLANMDKGGGQFLNNIKEMSGGGDMYKQVLYSIFGGQLSKTRINQIIDKGGGFDKISEEARKASGGMDFAASAESIEGVSARRTADRESTYEMVGFDTISKFDELANKVTESIDKGADKLVSAFEGNDFKASMAKSFAMALASMPFFGQRAAKEIVDAMMRKLE